MNHVNASINAGISARERDQRMEAKYIMPFIESVKTVFSTMIRLEVTLGVPHLSQMLPKYDISGIIGFSGDVVGSIVLSMPSEVARHVVASFAGAEMEVGTPDFADALGEIVNMVSGAAKAKFTSKDVRISTPSVVIGAGHVIARPAKAVCISLPCKLACGEFSLHIAILDEGRKTNIAA